MALTNGVKFYNPAFDVTLARFISAISPRKELPIPIPSFAYGFNAKIMPIFQNTAAYCLINNEPHAASHIKIVYLIT